MFYFIVLIASSEVPCGVVGFIAFWWKFLIPTTTQIVIGTETRLVVALNGHRLSCTCVNCFSEIHSATLRTHSTMTLA